MNNYDDIIDMPYEASPRHKHMPLHDRAAQFAPFAALTGFEMIISEQARFTESRPELCDDDAEGLDKSFNELYEKLPEQPSVTLTYFVKDKYKDGGCLKDITGTLRRIDTFNREFIFLDKQTVPLDDVVAIKMNAG
ncbi:MAG: YolD-like family protein [Ruminococcus sp.]|nr:YolD-like family protein [Ruminococcus sp.]